MKISDEIIKQIPVLYQELGVKAQVAKKLGISSSTVSKYLAIYEALPADGENLTTTVVRKKGSPITPEMEKAINERYKECLNMSLVAREFNISSSTVKRHLTKENLDLVSSEYNDRDALFFYIYRLFGEQSEDQPVSTWNIIQMEKFRKEGMPYKGQLLSLKYFYEVKKNSIKKSNGSIGIISYIFSEAELYYKNQAIKADEITKMIQKQLEKDRIEIKYNPADYFNRGKRKRKEKLIDLDTLGDC